MLATYTLLHGGMATTHIRLGLILQGMTTSVHAGGGDEPTGPRCSIFEGVNASFMPWFIAFCAWVAWKKPELSDLILGVSRRPRIADPAAPTNIEKKRRKE